MEMSTHRPDDAHPPAGCVCLTGAAGYVASYILKSLLERGHKVRGTVRDLTAHEKLAPLRALPGASERLQLIQADMDVSGTFAAMLAGCDTLIHTVTPFPYPTDGSLPYDSVAEIASQQTEPTLARTRALLQAAASAGVRKVVLTSSTTTMTVRAEKREVLDESCWTDVEYVRKRQLAWPGGAGALTKTLQELLAISLCEELGLRLVTVHPTLVMGPSFTGRVSTALDLLLRLGTGLGVPFFESGAGMIPDGFVPFVDVRDVALVHARVVECEEAEGRYLVSFNSEHAEEIVTCMREASTVFGGREVMRVDSVDGKRHGVAGRVDCSKVRGLGVEGVEWRETISEGARVVEGCVRDGRD